MISVPILYLGGEEDTLVDTQEEARILREKVSGNAHVPVPRLRSLRLGGTSTRIARTHEQLPSAGQTSRGGLIG